jgi:hypothetical protein
MTGRRPKTQEEINRKKNRTIVAAKLPPDIYRQLKMYCAKSGQNVNQALRLIISNFLSTNA